jgi:hypothetical protein
MSAIHSSYDDALAAFGRRLGREKEIALYRLNEEEKQYAFSLVDMKKARLTNDSDGALAVAAPGPFAPFVRALTLRAFG